jgi:hypothetical protein
MLIDQLAAVEDAPNLSTMRRVDFRRAARWYYDELPAAFETLANVLRALEQNTAVTAVGPEDAGHFYLLRAANHFDRDLVNHLLARLTMLDFRQLFICNKDLFYETYRSWPEAKREYVAQFLAETFIADSQSEWYRLYGGEPDTDEGSADGTESRSAVQGALRFVNNRDWAGGVT